MKGLILAAGYGKRLQPITHTLPKPMVPLCNRPLIAWAIESYLQFGVRELIINLHHLPEPMEIFIANEYVQRAVIVFSYEQQILGTGGAIRRMQPLLEEEEEFFLVNGDTVQFPRYDALRTARNDHLAALTLRHPPENDRFTPVWLENGRITGFGEGRGHKLMFAGSHCISSRIFRHLPDEEEFGIVDRVYQPLLESGEESLAGVVDDGLWFDIGTLQRFVSASRGMLEAMVRGEIAAPAGSHIEGDSLMHDTARGEVAASIVGARSRVAGAVRDSIIWDDCTVDASLERCIVTHGATVTGEHRDALITTEGVFRL